MRVSKGFLDSIWEKARPNNFSLFGMSIKTNREYKPNDKIVINISLELDMGTITIEKLKASVVRVDKLVGFYEYGLEFDKKVIEDTESLTTTNLMRIENFLEKQQALSAKLLNKSA